MLQIGKHLDSTVGLVFVFQPRQFQTVAIVNSTTTSTLESGGVFFCILIYREPTGGKKRPRLYTLYVYLHCRLCAFFFPFHLLYVKKYI